MTIVRLSIGLPGTIASWGIDYIKLDICIFTFAKDDKQENINGYEGWQVEGNLERAHAKWRKLLDESGRDIALEVTSGYRDWYPLYAQMGWTALGDIRKGGPFKHSGGGAIFDSEDPRSVMAIAETNNSLAEFAGNGYWNHPEMLVVGERHGLNVEEQRAHFALWCIMSLPLMLGNDPRTMTDEEVEIITNKKAIEVDQDPTEQGRRIIDYGDAEVWAKRLTSGVAVMLLNRGKEKSTAIPFDLSEIGLSGKRDVYDIWEKKSLGKSNGKVSLDVKPSACRFILID